MKIIHMQPKMEMLRESEYMCYIDVLGLRHFGIGTVPSEAEHNLITKLKKTVDIFRTYYEID